MPPSNLEGPFNDKDHNEICRVLASQMQESYEQLADVNMLEQDPTNIKQAMNHPLHTPFWIQFEEKEIKGLWDRRCFKKWRKSELLKTD